MSETQSYKTVTLTQDQALDVEIAIGHRLCYLRERIRHHPELVAEYESLRAAVELLVKAELTK